MQNDTSILTFSSRDEYAREEIAEKIIKLIDSPLETSPLIVDGEWGTGKTEFCYKLKNKLHKNNGNNVIYIDAFKADHIDEPLFTILAEIIQLLPNNEEEKNNFLKKIIPFCGFVMKTAAKAGVGHILRQDVESLNGELEKTLDDATQKIADKAIEDSIDSQIKKVLDEHVNASQNLEMLQKAVKEISKNKQIIILLDELDRCRPNFAVKMLETIKHIFEIPKVHFILFMNKKQLLAAINHCYGNGVDADKYLDKFIKLYIVLPSEFISKEFPFEENTDLSHDKIKLASVQHCIKLINDNKIDNLNIIYKCDSNDCALSTIIYKFFTANTISLREAETFERNLKVYLHLSENAFAEQDKIPFELIGILIHCFKPELAKIYREIPLGNNPFDNKVLLSAFGFTTSSFNNILADLNDDENKYNENTINFYNIIKVFIFPSLNNSSLRNFSVNQREEAPKNETIVKTIKTLNLVSASSDKR